MDDKKMILTLDSGEQIEALILFTHHSEEFGHNYVVFLPDGEEQYSAARYVEDDGTNGSLEPVETEEEWALLEKLLDDYFKDLDDEDEEDN